MHDTGTIPSASPQTNPSSVPHSGHPPTAMNAPHHDEEENAPSTPTNQPIVTDPEALLRAPFRRTARPNTYGHVQPRHINFDEYATEDADEHNDAGAN